MDLISLANTTTDQQIKKDINKIIVEKHMDDLVRIHVREIDKQYEEKTKFEVLYDHVELGDTRVG